MAGEQAVDEPNAIANEQAEGETQKTGTGYQPSIHSRETISRKRKGQRDGRGDEHHASNGADAKNKQIQYGPIRGANGAQDEQRYSRGTCEAVHDADEQRPERLV